MKIIRRTVWNDQVKLTATLLNAIAIGILGVAVIGPLAQPDNPFYGWGGGSDKLAAITENTEKFTAPSFFYVLEWNVIFTALAVHFVAHMVLRRQLDE